MKNIAVFQLKGRFGNQMFIYAFAKALEAKYNFEIYFDDYELKKDSELNFAERGFTVDNSLHVFNLNERYASRELIENLKQIKHRTYLKIVRRFFQLPEYVNGMMTEEQPFVFHPFFLKNYGSVIYDGYFQNERYFKSVEHIIRKQFVFPEFLENDSFNFNLAQKIKACAEPVFVHVRRGDYCDLGLDLPIEYYRKACAYIKNKIPEAEFFVFSDDAEHIKKSFDIGYDFAAVDGVNFANKEDYKDMHLMSLCRHAVIANSSFSWWGAWLINNRDKIVAAPYPWIKFKSEKQSKNSSSIICDDWIKIEANENRKVI